MSEREEKYFETFMASVDQFIRKMPRCFPRYEDDGKVSYDYLNEDFREDLRNYVKQDFEKLCQNGSVLFIDYNPMLSMADGMKIDEEKLHSYEELQRWVTELRKNHNIKIKIDNED